MPTRILGGFADGNEGFNAMHVGVGTPIVFTIAPILGKGFPKGLCGCIPQPFIDDRNYLCKERFSAVDACQHGGCCTQTNLNVIIGRFAGHSARLTEPATMSLVRIEAIKRGERMFRQLSGTRYAMHDAQGCRVEATRSKHKLWFAPWYRGSVGPKISKTTLYKWRSQGKLQYVGEIAFKPSAVTGIIQPSGDHDGTPGGDGFLNVLRGFLSMDLN